MYDGSTPRLSLLAAQTSGHPLPGFVTYIGAAIFIVVGVLSVANPMTIYRLQTLQYRNPEAFAPSKVGLVLTRIMGVGSVAIGLFLIVYALRR